jgi:hypothetical protein
MAILYCHPDEEINMLVVLRKNRKFMAFMPSHFNHILHQTFKWTILKQVDNEEKAEEWATQFNVLGMIHVLSVECLKQIKYN